MLVILTSYKYVTPTPQVGMTLCEKWTRKIAPTPSVILSLDESKSPATNNAAMSVDHRWAPVYDTKAWHPRANGRPHMQHDCDSGCSEPESTARIGLARATDHPCRQILKTRACALLEGTHRLGHHRQPHHGWGDVRQHRTAKLISEWSCRPGPGPHQHKGAVSTPRHRGKVGARIQL
jgi:hypothetical protein